MKGFFNSSIGKKLIMSLSGLFLIVFLLVHLTVNSFMLFGQEAFNIGAHFMATNPLIKIMEPILAAGFIVHIVYSLILGFQNLKARPVKYAVENTSRTSTVAALNMLVLGGLVSVFLVIHLINFYFKMKFGEMTTVFLEGVAMDDAYSLAVETFSRWYYVLLYVLGAFFLMLHLSHGFQSAFQTVGLNNENWRKRWSAIGNVFSAIFGLGYSGIAVIMFVKSILA